MSLHPDADAFVAAILRDPTDVTTRLVFADWLEETGTQSNVAWARFIRLKADAGRHPADSPECEEAELLAAEFWWQIEAKLTIPARVFAAHPRSLLALLPPWAFTVRFGDFEPTRPVLELVPESVARENTALPFDERGRQLFVAAVEPGDYDLLQKLQFILNRDVVAVRGEVDDLRDAINRNYGQTETESVDCVSYESPLIGLDGDDTSGAIYGIFYMAFSRNCSGFEMDRGRTDSVLRYTPRAAPVPDERQPREVFSRLLDHFLSLPVDAEYTADGLRCRDFDIPLLSGRRFPATLERRRGLLGTYWFRVRFRWEDRG